MTVENVGTRVTRPKPMRNLRWVKTLTRWRMGEKSMEILSSQHSDEEIDEVLKTGGIGGIHSESDRLLGNGRRKRSLVLHRRLFFGHWRSAGRSRRRRKRCRFFLRRQEIVLLRSI